MGPRSFWGKIPTIAGSLMQVIGGSMIELARIGPGAPYNTDTILLANNSRLRRHARSRHHPYGA